MESILSILLQLSQNIKNKVLWLKDIGGYYEISKGNDVEYSRLNKKFFYYVAKYAQMIYGTVPVKDLCDENSLLTNPQFMLSKPNVKQIKVVRCPIIFKKYDVSKSGKRTRSK